jgi:alkylation response protein AidB-like acyl-CoA dehydrogenase
MQFAFTEEQQLIRESARAFFNESVSSERVRAALRTEVGYEQDLWNAMVREMGWAGTAIPNAYGGAGLGMVELAILQYEQGSRLAPSPFFSTVCLAAPIVMAIAHEWQKIELLGRIARGEIRMAAAITGARGVPGCEGITAELQRIGRHHRLMGQSGFVIHAHACDLMLVAARAPGTAGTEGISVVCLDAGTHGVSVDEPVMLDLTRRMARLRFDAVEILPDAVLGELEAAGDALESAFQRARIALAAEAAGGAEWALDATCAYARQRIQFGRPIGSFQAVKHQLADMKVRLEAAKSALWYSACVADEIDAELAEAAAIAKACCCDAFYRCTADAIQLHGGMGFTWEHDAHLYFKRARAVSSLLGSPSWQRERLARLMGLGGAGTAPTF